MQPHRAADSRPGGCALGTQRARFTRYAIKPEAFLLAAATGEIGMGCHGGTMAGYLSGRTGQVPVTRSMTKSSLGKCLLLGRPGTRATSFRPASAKS